MEFFLQKTHQNLKTFLIPNYVNKIKLWVLVLRFSKIWGKQPNCDSVVNLLKGSVESPMVRSPGLSPGSTLDQQTAKPTDFWTKEGHVPVIHNTSDGLTSSDKEI